jgi:hypothetical protein
MTIVDQTMQEECQYIVIFLLLFSCWNKYVL